MSRTSASVFCHALPIITGAHGYYRYRLYHVILVRIYIMYLRHQLSRNLTRTLITRVAHVTRYDAKFHRPSERRVTCGYCTQYNVCSFGTSSFGATTTRREKPCSASGAPRGQLHVTATIRDKYTVYHNYYFYYCFISPGRVRDDYKNAQHRSHMNTKIIL